MWRGVQGKPQTGLIDCLYDATVQQLADMTRTPFARGKNLARTLVARNTAELLSTLTTLTSR